MKYNDNGVARDIIFKAIGVADVKQNGTSVVTENIAEITTQEVSYNQIVTSGTKIAEITIDDTTTDIYAPQGGGGTSTDVQVNGSSITSDGVANILTEGTYSSSNKMITKSSLLDIIYPINSIYMSVSSTNPSNLFGGTWVNIGQGKTLVGVDTTDADFNTVEKTGGAKTHTHSQGSTGGPSSNTSGGPSTDTSGGPSNNTSGSTTLTTNQIPSHTHTFTGSSATTSESGAHRHSTQGQWRTPATGNDRALAYNQITGDPVRTDNPILSAGAHTHTLTAKGSNSNTGGGQGHTHTLSSHTHSLSSHTHSLSSHTHTNPNTNSSSSLQPYLTVYIWKRTA